jgi:hypothetical protein
MNFAQEWVCNNSRGKKLIVRCMFHHLKLGSTSINCLMDDTTLINKMRHVPAQHTYRVL